MHFSWNEQEIVKNLELLRAKKVEELKLIVIQLQMVEIPACRERLEKESSDDDIVTEGKLKNWLKSYHDPARANSQTFFSSMGRTYSPTYLQKLDELKVYERILDVIKGFIAAKEIVQSETTATAEHVLKTLTSNTPTTPATLVPKSKL